MRFIVLMKLFTHLNKIIENKSLTSRNASKVYVHGSRNEATKSGVIVVEFLLYCLFCCRYYFPLFMYCSCL